MPSAESEAAHGACPRASPRVAPAPSGARVVAGSYAGGRSAAGETGPGESRVREATPQAGGCASGAFAVWEPGRVPEAEASAAAGGGGGALACCSSETRAARASSAPVFMVWEVLPRRTRSTASAVKAPGTTAPGAPPSNPGSGAAAPQTTKGSCCRVTANTPSSRRREAYASCPSVAIRLGTSNMRRSQIAVAIGHCHE